MRGPLGVCAIYIHVPCNPKLFKKGDFKQPETKEAEPLQPSLKVCTVAQEKNSYILYGATEHVDHFKFKRGHVL